MQQSPDGSISDVYMDADLTEEDVNPVKAKLADNLFHQVPVGVGGKSDIK